MDLIAKYPDVSFAPADEFYYDAADEIIYYAEAELAHTQGRVALLHELAHAQLNHFDYASDLELVLMEARAWHATRQLAQEHHVPIDEAYIDRCLATYAVWLEARATCPVCNNFSLQTGGQSYRCFRCQARWRIQTTQRGHNRRELVG